MGFRPGGNSRTRTRHGDVTPPEYRTSSHWPCVTILPCGYHSRIMFPYAGLSRLPSLSPSDTGRSVALFRSLPPSKSVFTTPGSCGAGEDLNLTCPRVFSLCLCPTVLAFARVTGIKFLARPHDAASTYSATAPCYRSLIFLAHLNSSVGRKCGHRGPGHPFRLLPSYPQTV